jgi:hypothetical protein
VDIQDGPEFKPAMWVQAACGPLVKSAQQGSSFLHSALVTAPAPPLLLPPVSLPGLPPSLPLLLPASPLESLHTSLQFCAAQDPTASDALLQAEDDGLLPQLSAQKSLYCEPHELFTQLKQASEVPPGAEQFAAPPLELPEPPLESPASPVEFVPLVDLSSEPPQATASEVAIRLRTRAMDFFIGGFLCKGYAAHTRVSSAGVGSRLAVANPESKRGRACCWQLP